MIEEASAVHLRNSFQCLIVLLLNCCVYSSNLILLGFSLHPLDFTVTFCLSSHTVQVTAGLCKYLVRPESCKAKLWLLRDLTSAVTDKEQLHITHTVLIHSLYSVFIFCYSSFFDWNVILCDTKWYMTCLKHCNTDFDQNYNLIKTSGLSYFDKIILNDPLDTLGLFTEGYSALSV